MFFRKYHIKSRNIDFLSAIHVIVGFIFYIPIMALYFKGHLSSITQVALIFLVMTFTAAILEVPSGAIADLFGRKRSFILGQSSFLIGLLLILLVRNIYGFMAYALLAGIAGSLMSGTQEALIYDTLKSEKKEVHYKRIWGILSSLWPLTAIIGSLVGGYLAKISLTLPIVLSFIPLTIAFFLAFFLKEPEYEKEKHSNIFRQMFHSVKDVINNKQILFLALTSLILLAFGESAHILKPIFLEFKQMPLEIFGYVFALTFGLSSIGHYFSDSLSDKIGNKNTIILSVILFPVLLILAALTSGITSMIFLVLTSLPYGLRRPVISHMLNTEASSSKRTTIISIKNLMDAIGIGLGGLLLGYIADLYTINTAYILAGVLMFTSVVAAMFLKERK